MNLTAVLIHLLPEWILLIGGCVVLLVGLTAADRSKNRAPLLAFICLAAAFAATLWLGSPDGKVQALGLWFNSLTYYARWITLLIGMLVILVNWNQSATEERGEYMALILFSLLGVLLTASANDLVVLFFAIELVSVPTYVLIALSRLEVRASEAAVKYFFLGALSTALFAYGLSFIFGAGGTMTLDAIFGSSMASPLTTGAAWSSPLTVGFLLVFAGLAFKIAAVPLHWYVPDVYEGAAAPVTGMLGFVPKFAGFLALIKLFSACDWQLPDRFLWIIWLVAAATMTAGNVLALLQNNVKRILAYSSIAHTGYMLIGLLVGPAAGAGPMGDGTAALLFYIAIYGVMNLGAFAFLSSFSTKGRDIETVEDLGGLATRAPLAALGLAVCIFALMGFPPTAGFMGKFYVFGSAFSVPRDHSFQFPMLILAIIAVINSAIGAAYYLRIVAAVYMGKETESRIAVGGRPLRWGLAFCGLSMVALFLRPHVLVTQARLATIALHGAMTKSPVTASAE